MISRLFRTGREAGSAWLQQHYDAIGRHATVDIRRDYLDDTRLELPTPAPSAVRRLSELRFKPWLARLLRRQAPR
jgi:NTE family protein